MKKNESIIIASYRRPEDADAVLQELRRTDLSDKNVGLLVRDDDQKTRYKSLKQLDGDGDNQVGKGAAVGAAAGAGGGALWALGIAAGMLPAIGPVVGGGILGALLASAGTGAAAGGIVGSLIGLGMSDEDAEFASKEIKSGATVIAVKAPDDRAQVLEILNRHRADFAPSIGVYDRSIRNTAVDQRPIV